METASSQALSSHQLHPALCGAGNFCPTSKGLGTRWVRTGQSEAQQGLDGESLPFPSIVVSKGGAVTGRVR